MSEGWNDIWSGWWAIDRALVAYVLFLILFIGMYLWDTRK
jgi:hypothetical protein